MTAFKIERCVISSLLGGLFQAVKVGSVHGAGVVLCVDG